MMVMMMIMIIITFMMMIMIVIFFIIIIIIIIILLLLLITSCFMQSTLWILPMGFSYKNSGYFTERNEYIDDSIGKARGRAVA